jgi:methylated-DNA-protein-cysteine methyltransferase related protein
MAKSPFFARIKSDVLQIIAHIPEGRLSTFADIGAHLDVMPRHIAYILTMLEDETKMMLQWHRVVSADGDLGKPKYAPDGTSQSELLAAEGILISKNSVNSLLLYHINIDALNSGVPMQKRPSDAPAR